MRMAVVVEKASDLANIYFFEFDGGSSAFADAHGQRRKWQLSGSQLSPRLLQVRTAAFPAASWQDPTQSGRSNFRKAADQAHRDSTSFAAPKLPFVTSRTRPQTADGRFSPKLTLSATAHL